MTGTIVAVAPTLSKWFRITIRWLPRGKWWGSPPPLTGSSRRQVVADLCRIIVSNSSCSKVISRISNTEGLGNNGCRMIGSSSRRTATRNGGKVRLDPMEDMDGAVAPPEMRRHASRGSRQCIISSSLMGLTCRTVTLETDTTLTRISTMILTRCALGLKIMWGSRGGVFESS